MAFADVLKGIGSGLEKGAKVAGEVLASVGKAIAEEESGQAPQILAERRAHQQKMDDAGIESQANEIEQQLHMGRQYGTLTGEQQNQLVDRLSQLYAHPSQAPNLMKRLQRVIHPTGATYSHNEPALPNATPEGGVFGYEQKQKDESEKRKLAETLQNQKELAQYRQDLKPEVFKPLPGVHPFKVGDKYYQPGTNSDGDMVNKEVQGYTPPAAKPIFRNVRGHSVLLDAQGNVLRDLGPTGTAKVTTHQVMQPGDDGQMHMVTLTSVSTPEGGVIEVHNPEVDTSATQAKPMAHTMQKPTTGAKPVQTKASNIVPGFSTMAQNKTRTPAQKKADTDFVGATQLASLADQVAAKPNDAINQKRLAVALERQSAGRFTTQALSYVMKSGWGNSIEQWANNPSTGALPPDVMRQLVDGAHQYLKSVKDERAAAYAPSPSAGGGSDIDDIVNALKGAK